VDIKPKNASLCLNLTQMYRPKLNNKHLTFSLAKGEDYDFQKRGPFDVIIEIGAMLYFNRSEISGFLERAWTSLSRGGILLVHENIQHPKHIKDYKVMFTVDELDGLLNPFGEIKRFDPAKMAFVSKDEADNRSVFRAVVKD
jgi:cyclopropane fatty-acyl-phospholipid synthase-like methyltransferase